MKINDIVESAGVGRITKQNQTPDVGPNEISKQAAKFGNKVDKDGYPPLLRTNESLTEAPVDKLKTAVIKQVQATDDQILLDRIYTVLNQTNLQDRIQGVIAKETDAKKYSKVIADTIINTPGNYQEKYNFVKAYPNGYINVDALMSGELVPFDKLVVGNDFAQRVFYNLFNFRPETAGPGEFALAALSPRIKMRSKGDLFIDNKYIEVKTSAGQTPSSGGGRLGEPGLLNPQGVKALIEKHIKKKLPAKDIYIQQLGPLLKANIKDPAALNLAVSEITSSIFGAATPKLNKAILSDGPVLGEYLRANWTKYQKEAGWAGILLLNRAGGAARYFNSPDSMANSIYSTKAVIVSQDVAKASRQILSQVTLKTS